MIVPIGITSRNVNSSSAVFQHPPQRLLFLSNAFFAIVPENNRKARPKSGCAMDKEDLWAHLGLDNEGLF